MPPGCSTVYWNFARFALLTSFSICLMGCANQTSVTRPRAPGVAVVSSDSWVFEWGEADETEVDPHECLADGLEDRNVDVISQREFLTTAFPDMAPDKVPRTPEYLEISLAHPTVRRRVADRGIEYLVYVTGEIDYENGWATGSCGLASAGLGCWAYGEVDKTSRLNAVVIDTHMAQQFNTQTAENTGKTWIVIIGIVPVWNEADSRTGACIELANNIYQMLSAERPRWKINAISQVEAPK